LAYARCLVRLALGDGRAFATWFDYRPGHAPEHRTAEERRGAAAVDSMARALLAGRLEAAPRYLLAAPHAAMEPDGASGLLGGCSRALLGGLHRASSALYWRSDSYQALRASEPMVRFTAGVHALLSLPGARRAARRGRPTAPGVGLGGGLGGGGVKRRRGGGVSRGPGGAARAPPRGPPPPPPRPATRRQRPEPPARVAASLPPDCRRHAG